MGQQDMKSHFVKMILPYLGDADTAASLADDILFHFPSQMFRPAYAVLGASNKRQLVIGLRDLANDIEAGSDDNGGGGFGKDADFDWQTDEEDLRVGLSFDISLPQKSDFDLVDAKEELKGGHAVRLDAPPFYAEISPVSLGSTQRSKFSVVTDGGVLKPTTPWVDAIYGDLFVTAGEALVAAKDYIEAEIAKRDSE